MRIATILAASLALLCGTARADTEQLKKELADKVAMAQGECSMNKRGFVVKQGKRHDYTRPCVMLIQPGNDKEGWLLIFRADQKPDYLINLKYKSGKQKVVVRAGDES